MKLIKDLGMRDYVSPRKGTIRREKMGLFFCPVCKKQDILRPIFNGKKSATCGKGCKDNGCTRHSQCDSVIYRTWANMKARCNNAKREDYKYYGAFGISYPKSWETFEGFFSDMGLTYKKGLTIDRKDKDLDYSKENCQWITMHQNRIKDQIKEVHKYSQDGVLQAIYPSTHEAARQEFPEIEDIKALRTKASGIGHAARGTRPGYIGFIWKYV